MTSQNGGKIKSHIEYEEIAPLVPVFQCIEAISNIT